MIAECPQPPGAKMRCGIIYFFLQIRPPTHDGPNASIIFRKIILDNAWLKAPAAFPSPNYIKFL